MPDHSYSIALRFWHPRATPEAITRALGVEPEVAHTRGEPRMTPAGLRLPGTYRENYWHARPVGARWYRARTASVETRLEALLERIAPQRRFLRRLLATEGKGLVHVSTCGTGNYAVELPPALLAQCAEMRLSLAVDVYPVPQR